ncbi:hypothetical protein M8J77_016634 [Diaphorina citri]|nr:hypothetical protein M8J77_016634 [Diaphorina citri]
MVCPGSVFITVLISALGLVSASISKALRYQAPDECKWFAVTSEGAEIEVPSAAEPDQEVALVCKLRTINSEIENTNFSIIQAQYTVRLRIECGDMLFFQSSLSPGSFQTLIDLKDLSVEFCKIGNLSAGSFRGLRKLKTLTLRTHNTDWSTMSLDISHNVFTDELQSLESLDLSMNSIWTLPDAIFCPLQSLSYLNLTQNKLSNVATFSFSNYDTARCGINLRVLDLSNNSFDSLPAEGFSRLSRLQELYLQGNILTFLADHALDGLNSLTVLNLSVNNLVNIPPELFNQSRDLKEVYLQNNSINVLAPGIFNVLTQLIVLDLSNNELTEEWVNAATFSGLHRLVVLNIAYNKMNKLDSSIFKDLYRLQVLHLENNQIESIHRNTFASLSNLHTLIMSNNKLKRIESNSLDSLTALSVLSLDNNELEYIEENALKNSTSLQDFHLNGNKLTEIPKVLRNLHSLKTLDLGDNLITEINNLSLNSLHQLAGLRLTENNISNISKGVFEKLSVLTILNLASNKIQKVEAGTFDNNSNLVAIRLDGNYLTDIGGLFPKLPNLVWLNISENLLEWFDYALIPADLQWLDIHGNQISELGNYFEIESQLRLTYFDASSNKLTELTGNAIPHSVENLFLTNNLISKVQPYTFFMKPNLTRVDLVGNRLKNINQTALRISPLPSHKNIPDFYIGENPFQCDCNMQWLQSYSVNKERNKPNLVDLDTVTCKLLYNRANPAILLKEAHSNQFLCEYETNCAPLCHCCDFDACDCEMTCPNNCTCYHDVSWEANVIDCSTGGYDNQLPPRIPMDATELYLDGNRIPVVGSHSFIGRKKLQILFLNSSHVETIHNKTFNGLKELIILRLDDNRLTEIRGYEFERLENLRELYLQYNKIIYISNRTFLSLTHLKVLQLDHNRITSFAVWHLSSQIQSITLTSNPWSCDCDFTEKFRDYLQRSRSSVHDISQIRCMTGSEVGFTIMRTVIPSCNVVSTNVSSHSNNNNNTTTTTTTTIFIPEHSPMNGSFILSELQPQQDYVFLLIILVSASFVLVLLLILIIIYRQEMRVWFHSRFGVRLFYKSSEIEMDDRDKLFDAFVSYSSKDEAFVAEELAPILENGDPAYKLCLHYREFPVGGYIGDTIVQAVESSRRTIMVLSENFIKSEWCRYEFKSAHHQVLRGKKRLIVILLGEVPQKDLDPDIRLYLKSNTYLQWGDKLFWEKLKFALPDVPNNQRNNNNRNQVRHLNHSAHHHNHNHRHHQHHHNNTR